MHDANAKPDTTANIFMVDCTGTILRAIESGLPQTDIAWDYGQAIRSEAAGVEAPDWSKINRAILARWKRSALERIKRKAWQLSGVKAV